MARQTSILAFREIEASGVLGRCQLEVYAALYKHGPCTGSELFKKTFDHKNPTHSNIVTRLGELRDMGVVYESDKRECKVTGMNVLTWDVTDRLPIRRVKEAKPSRKQLVERISKLERVRTAAIAYQRLPHSPQYWTLTEALKDCEEP